MMIIERCARIFWGLRDSKSARVRTPASDSASYGTAYFITLRTLNYSAEIYSCAESMD